MLTTGFKYYFGLSMALAFTAIVYGYVSGGGNVGPVSLGWKGGVGDHIGYTLLVGLATVTGLAGLVLVAVQINQNSGEIEQSRKLAYGQMLTETYGQINDTYMTFMSDDPRSSLAKAVLNPDQLSPQDAVALDAYYNSVIWVWYGIIRMEEETGIKRDWRGTVANGAREHFTTKPGRRRLKEWVERPNWGTQADMSEYYGSAWSELHDVALNAIGEADDDSRFSVTRRYEAILGSETSPQQPLND